VKLKRTEKMVPIFWATLNSQLIYCSRPRL